jgi:hypothetical protein
MAKKIEFFDCSSETDLQKAERIMKANEVHRREIVQFPYLMLIWDEVSQG